VQRSGPGPPSAPRRRNRHRRWQCCARRCSSRAEARSSSTGA
jgi:hypothetical protein